MNKPFKRKDLLGIRDLSAEEINTILHTAEAFREVSRRDVKKVPTLRGKTVINLFFEPSTRTRTSFELAAKRLSADAVNISTSTSSLAKGETILDMAKNLDAMAPHVIVVRHSSAGVPHQLAKASRASIVNAGDGSNEHPTQALLDAMTIREHKGKIEGLKVAILGDILHSRVARSNVHLLTKLGARVCIAGPGTLVPKDFAKLVDDNLEICQNIESAIEDSDVVMVLRIQKERMNQAFFPTMREYSIHYGLTKERLKLAKKDAIVLHPGPMNRGVEIASDVADGSSSLILNQVEYGLAVRMAVLYLLTGGEE
ncbi:MAG: aspartate carbamoyltransferase catalytic subunit [Pyrinomonadaceae bacterium]|nr:aspartate carbamoyltransferase catalytic subunit [Pyrinomonadaceae bacterium]MCX7640789.1 aspartate carbamoyltransferase catalytic subunit [Pyrinomonadaceae bacterium]MDW8304622.1 aspartate carbamoyltransferase catalytic subunit [Acidobacteriota bacterium]